MSNTTIHFPNQSAGEIYGYVGRDSNYTLLSASDTTTSTILTSGFVLYLPFSVKTATSVTWSSLVQSLGPAYPQITTTNDKILALQTQTGTGPVTTPIFTFESAGGTLYIPVTNILETSINVSDGIKALSSAAASTTSTLTGSVSTPTSGVPTSSTQSSSTSATTSTATPTKTPICTHDCINVSEGALAGGIVGAFIFGALLCALFAFLCIRQRNNKRSVSHSSSDGSSHDSALANVAARHEKSALVVAGASSTGWHKHLPQEKDDGSITKLFNSVFEQVKIHLEGYYCDDPRHISNVTIEGLRKLSQDDLPSVLSQTEKHRTILETILLRLIVHRISGRSDIEDSFLPRELSRIVKRNDWYMERDSASTGTISTGKKQGFSQALTQWRQLTGFLLPEHRTDQNYQDELRVKVQTAGQKVDAAFSLWELSGKSSDKRMESLTQILLQASDAGVLLFTQPTTFLFDWTPPAAKRSVQGVTISPGLIREVHGSNKEDVLIRASYIWVRKGVDKTEGAPHA